MWLGLRMHRSLFDGRFPDGATATNAAATLSDLAAATWRADTCTLSLRPEIELWDVAKLRTDTTIIPIDEERLVSAIIEEYVPERGTCHTHLTLAAR